MPPQRTQSERKRPRPPRTSASRYDLTRCSPGSEVPSLSSSSTKRPAARQRRTTSARTTMPSASSSNALGLANVVATSPSKPARSISQPLKGDATATIEGQPTEHNAVAPLNEQEMTEFPFPLQTSTTLSLSLPQGASPTQAFTFPEGHQHTPSSHITDLLSNWNAFTPSPGSGRFDSRPELQSLVSPDEALPLSDLIREEYIDASPSLDPASQTPSKPTAFPRAGFGGLHLTPPEVDEVRIVNSPRATSPFSPAYIPGKSLFSPTRAVSSTDTRPPPPIPQRQLSWSKTASAHLQAQTEGGRRCSAPSQRVKGKDRSSYTDPRHSPIHSLSRSHPRPQRQDSLPSAGLEHPHLNDVFAPQYQLAILGPPPLRSASFRYPRPSPPATLAKPKELIRKTTHVTTLAGQSGGRLTSETATRCLTDHPLPAQFTSRYLLQDELGVGGFGFVCSALVINEAPAPTTPTGGLVLAPGSEVAVKFIFNDRMWRKHKEMIDGWPIEAYVLQRCQHPGIIGFYEVFEDDKFFYLVQELHGDPWNPDHMLEPLTGSTNQASSVPSTPFSPPRLSTFGVLTQSPIPHLPNPVSPSTIGYDPDTSPTLVRRPIMARRASHDLFEAVEHQRFSEFEARVIFRQIVEAVAYLHKRKIFHRDLKDENIVIDRNLHIKIVDFGSAVIEDELCVPTVYDQFRGTIAYASAEILNGESYHAGPADIWSMGILLSILFTGESPFPDISHARQGKIKPKHPIPPGPFDLIKRCLVPKPEFRISIDGVRAHYWLTGTPRKSFVLM